MIKTTVQHKNRHDSVPPVYVYLRFNCALAILSTPERKAAITNIAHTPAWFTLVVINTPKCPYCEVACIHIYHFQPILKLYNYEPVCIAVAINLR